MHMWNQMIQQLSASTSLDVEKISMSSRMSAQNSLVLLDESQLSVMRSQQSMSDQRSASAHQSAYSSGKSLLHGT